LIDHGNLCDELDCAFGAVLLADSASDASELADLFCITLARRAMGRPRRRDNVQSGSDLEYRDWLNLGVMAEILLNSKILGIVKKEERRREMPPFVYSRVRLLSAPHYQIGSHKQSSDRKHR